MKRVKEKVERSLGVKLFLKAERCSSPKCVMVRRPTRPGQHGRRRTQISEYKRQLQEKRKIQVYFGLSSRQVGRLFEKSKDRVVEMLQHRLDSVVFRLGFARSPRTARQFISHGHILVGGRKVTVPSYRVRVGETVAVRPASRERKVFEDINIRLKAYTPPEWLSLDRESLTGRCEKRSTEVREPFPFNVDLVGQFFAR